MRPPNPIHERLADIPVTTRTLPLLGGRTAIWDYGPAHAERTVMLVHGFRGTHHGLANLIALLPEVRFIAPDLPGFGASTPLDRPHSLDAYAEWLLALLEAEDPAGTATVLGHSFGSMIVAAAAERLRQTSIVLVNPIAENALEGPERLLTNLGVLYYRIGAALPGRLGRALLGAPAITRIMSEVMATTRSRALRRWIHAEHREHFSEFADRDVLLEAFKASVSDDVRSHAGAFPPGTTLIAGERDQIAPPAASRRLHRAMPGSDLHLIGGVGHLIHYETPIPLARLVREHLAARPAAPGALPQRTTPKEQR